MRSQRSSLASASGRRLGSLSDRARLHILEARAARVRRLVYAHIGRPTIRAIDRGDRPPFGEFARDGQAFFVRRRA